MTNVTSLDDRRPPKAEPDLAEWLARADAAVASTAANPNQVLDHLLAAGCKVSFEMAADGPAIIAEVTMPDGSVIGDTGISAVAALVFAYSSGAWLADLPAALAATAEA